MKDKERSSCSKVVAARKPLCGWLTWMALTCCPFSVLCQTVNIEALLQQLSEKHEVHFIYSKNFLPQGSFSAVNKTNSTLEESLDLLASETSLEYSVNGKTILLRPRSGAVKPTETLQRPTARPSSREPESVTWPHDFQTIDLERKSIPPHSSLISSVPAPPQLEFQKAIAVLGAAGDEEHQVRLVKLGPVYVQPQRQYNFLEQMGEQQSEKSRKGSYRPLLSGSASSLDEQDAVFQYRLFNLSVVPGMGTNGLNPGGYYNGISINATVDYSAGNSILGVSGFSNFSRYSAYGIQMAGILNLVGGDMYQQKRSARSGAADLKSPFFGIQMAGVGNLVTGEASGFQGAMVNMVGGNSTGWQLGGFSNMSAGYGYGLQTSALFNFTGRFFTGVQLAAVNYARGELYGMQLGLFNRNRSMSGPSSPLGGKHGWQLGVYNASGQMDGFQLGVLNMSKNMDGLQFGLVNVSRRSKGVHVGLVNVFSDHSGWAYGLINVGPQVSGRIWANETFQTNVGITTGSENIANTFFYSRNVLLPNSTKYWARQAWGYGISKGMLFDPHDMHQLSYTDIRINLSWVNFDGMKKQPFNLLLNPHVVWGQKMSEGNYFTLGAGVNAWWAPIGGAYQLSYLEVATVTEAGYSWKLWPSLKIGLEFM